MLTPIQGPIPLPSPRTNGGAASAPPIAPPPTDPGDAVEIRNLVPQVKVESTAEPVQESRTPAPAAAVPTVLTMGLEEVKPPELVEAETVLQLARQFRVQIGQEYLRAVGPLIPSEFKPLVTELGTLAQTNGADPYQVLSMEVRSVAVAGCAAGNRALLHPDADPVALMREELDYQCQSKRLTQKATPEMLEQLSRIQPEGEDRMTGGFFVRELQKRVGSPQQDTAPSLLEQALESHPERIQAAGNPMAWAGLLEAGKPYAEQIEAVMAAENRAAEVVLSHQNLYRGAR